MDLKLIKQRGFTKGISSFVERWFKKFYEKRTERILAALKSSLTGFNEDKLHLHLMEIRSIII